MEFTDLRLRLRHFFKKYKKVILIILISWIIIIAINHFLKGYTPEPEPQTTYEPHKSVMSDTSSTPISLREKIEDLIDEYVNYCNDGNYQQAFDMLSEECRKYEYNDDINMFKEHVLIKMPTNVKYCIQDYSNSNLDGLDLYVYEVRYLNDIMATGLTGEKYEYTVEKYSFYEDKKGNIQMGTGNYIYHKDVKKISENEYLKIDVIDKVANYSAEFYTVKLTNRSDYTIVISDGQETNEIFLVLSNEIRNRATLTDVVLKPNESKTITCDFQKFSDDGDASDRIVFSAIRVMENYSGSDANEDIKQSEIENAISKFSMDVVL